MATVAKKLYQGAQATAATTRYTAPAGYQAQITEIWIVNTNATTDRTVTLYTHGSAAGNTLMTILAPKNGGILLQNLNIVLDAAQIFAAKQDVGTDIIITVYGVEVN